MAGASKTLGRARLFLMLSLCLSLLLSYAVANPLDPRADATSSVSKASSSAKPSSTPSAPASSKPAQKATGTKATAAGTTSPTATPEAPKNATSPELPANETSSGNISSQFNCIRTQAQSTDMKMGPFCQPQMFQDISAGRNYTVVWDPSVFNDTANITVFFKLVDDAGRGGFPRQTFTALNKHGYVEIAINEEFLENKTSNDLTLWIGPGNNQTELAGPTISLVESPAASSLPSSATASASSTSTPHKSKDETGVKVGVPIGLIALVAFSAALFFVLRRRRRGHGGSRSRGLGTVQVGGDDFRTARSRGNSFKDEPAQSLELQPRNGHRRQDSMGTWYGSSSDGGGGNGGGNTFRDEIARQRESRPW